MIINSIDSNYLIAGVIKKPTLAIPADRRKTILPRRKFVRQQKELTRSKTHLMRSVKPLNI
jgi:hypothetical protein